MSNPAYQGADVSWPQGNWAPGDHEFVIVGASTNDSGSLAVHTTYHRQVDNARAAGKEVGHYFFNGPLDPVGFAHFCVTNLYDFRAGDTLWLDVETQSNGGAPYTPAQALTFARTVQALLGVLPGVYLNSYEEHAADWSANVAAGQVLWLAAYVDPMPALRHWPSAVMWQHTSTPMDLDVAWFSQSQIRAMQNGKTPAPNPNNTPTPNLENTVELRIYYADAAPDKGKPDFGSTAVLTDSVGFVQTSTGLGARDTLDEWKAMAGSLKIPITEYHVGVNAFGLGRKHLTVVPGKAAS